MTGLVVAADGGNSKTDLVLAGLDGTVLAWAQGPGTRPLETGLAVTVDGLVALTHQALERAGLPREAPVAVGSFYLANVDLPDEHETMHAALDERRLVSRLEVENDTLAVLRAGSASGWGIGIVSGAGINAVGRSADGRVERFLGLGAITGDWGGGWGVAVAGIGAAVRAGDGRGAPTSLRGLVVEAFGDEAEPVSVAIHRGTIAPSRVFDFAPLVFAAATGGDDVAAGIVRRLGDEVVAYVAALAARLSVGDGPVEVVLGGGALQAGNPVLTAWIRSGAAKVAPGAVVRVLDVPPVAGALASALELAGAGPDALARVRASLRGGATPAPSS